MGTGSLPPGVRADLYDKLARRARKADLLVAIDSSGPPLAGGPGRRADLVKPNAHELAEATGRPSPRLARPSTPPRRLRSWGPGGPGQPWERRRLLVEEDLVLHAEVVIEHPRSAVGAGDALLSGSSRVARREDPR